jgi:hypothetical protein
MKKEFVLPYGVKVNDGVLYFGDHQVSCYDKPYKFSDVSKMCTKFAIRYTNSDTSHPTLCTTLDIVLAEEGGNAKPLVWLCGVRITQGKHLPSGYYSNWESVEYILNNLSQELQGCSEWFIEVDDDDYAWDEEKGEFRRMRKIETVTYEWDDD